MIVDFINLLHMNPIFVFLLGTILLYFSSEYLINYCSILADKMNLSPIVVGITIIAFGTSLPELVVSIKAAIDNNGNLVLGNIIGSNIANTSFVLGMAMFALYKAPDLFVKDKNLLFLLISTLLFFLFVLTSSINMYTGILFLFIFFIYLCVLFRNYKKTTDFVNEESYSYFKIIFYIIFSIIILSNGSELFLRGALGISVLLGIDSVTAGLTLVALGTSIPELFVTINSILKKKYEFIIGNVIGSNILNIILIGGVSFVITDLNYVINNIYIDIYILLFVTLLLLSVFILKRYIRTTAVIFIITYFAFLYINFSQKIT